MKAVYDEFLLSKNANEKIIVSSSRLNNEELINRSINDNDNITHINKEEKRIIEETFNYVKKSIFFHNIIEVLKEVNNNILKVRQKYISQIAMCSQI